MRQQRASEAWVRIGRLLSYCYHFSIANFFVMSFLLISRAKVSKSKSTHDFSVATQELEPVDPLLDGKYLNKLQQQMEKPSIALVMDQLQNKVPHCSSSSFFVNDKIFAFPYDFFRLKRSLGPVPNQRRLEKLAKRAQRSRKTKRIMKTTTCSCRPRCGQNWRPFTVSKKFVNIISDLNGSHWFAYLKWRSMLFVML